MSKCSCRGGWPGMPPCSCGAGETRPPAYKERAADGQVVVPVEPTEAMLDELLATPNVCSRSDMRKRYAAMIRAAGSRQNG